MKRDGSLNLDVPRGGAFSFRDVYYRTLSASWPRFFFYTLLIYLILNFLFSIGYFLCGPDALEGIADTEGFARWKDCFFFSVQTLATIGYGKISPSGSLPNLLVTFEALTGLFSQAIMTGLMYSRFARPTARIVFSEKAIVQTLDGVPCLMFRIANERQNQILETRIRVTLLMDEVTAEGERFRNFFDLKLERDFSPMFALSFSVVHEITPGSPLYGKTKEELSKLRVEIFASLNGLDEHFLQTIHARFSYTIEDVIWNYRFVDIISRDEAGKVHIAMDKIHEITPIAIQ